MSGSKSVIKRSLLGLLLCLPLMAHAWWNTEWAYRKKIALDIEVLDVMKRLQIGQLGLVTDRLVK